MEKSNNQPSISAPKLIPTFVAGFNAITSHIYLILFPAALDFLLWLGPLVRIKNLFQPIFDQSIQQMSSVYPADTLQLMQASKAAIFEFLDHFNLLIALRSYPIGIPSLMVGIGPLNNPLGLLSITEVGNSGSIIWIVIACLLVGIILGSIFFFLTAQATRTKPQPLNFTQIIDSVKNSLIYFGLTIVLGVGLAIPSVFIISSITLFFPSLGNVPFFILGLALIWILLPFAFSPHGIFTDHKSAWNSIQTSMRLVRKYLPGTGVFFLIAILTSQGLDMLWATPDPSDWMFIVGILGHAFISCGLVAASFVYYSKGLEFMQEKIRQEAAKQTHPDAAIQ